MKQKTQLSTMKHNFGDLVLAKHHTDVFNLNFTGCITFVCVQHTHVIYVSYEYKEFPGVLFFLMFVYI